MKISQYKVKTKDLKKKCNPAIFKFKSTAEIEPLKGIIGQDRAVHSLGFGLDIASQGYNVYLSGAAGTGKTTLAREMLQDKASQKPVPPDWCYVYNFKSPDAPRALKLPAGKGGEFKKDISSQMEKVIGQIAKALQSEEFEHQKNQILTKFVEQTNSMYLQLEEEARTHGFTVSRGENGISSIPLKDGEPLNQDEYMNMSEEERAELMKRSAVVQERLNEAFRQYKDLEKSTKEQVKDLEQETARAVATPYFSFLFDKYRSHEGIVEYIEDMQQDLLENMELFIKQQEQSYPLNIFQQIDRRTSLRRYQVNLIVDNAELEHAPVIFEKNPNFANLFGQIEYEGEFGVLATDFSKIKPGAVHKANGGYLVIQINDLMKSFYVWDTFKKVLSNREIAVESLGRMFGFSNSETLQPEPIPVNLKVILIGESLFYYLLYAHDEEFQKLFKIRADFDVEMDRTKKHMLDYARFISSVCRAENLRHFTPQAVGVVIDYGSWMVADKIKLSTSFNKLVEIIYEANCWADYDGADLVDAKHVGKAIQEKKYRSSMVEERIQEAIERDTLIISTRGEKIGEINGLAVYDMGDYAFGKPVRITAKTFMGEKGLVNIEREIHLSGSIHSKGVLTLSGYMGAQYAQDKPLSLSASLTFEQSYQGIEGDSASSAELYALISSLAEVPIKQGIAVTGSVNQNGEIQPVGGVNQKIEGFFKVCQRQGLTGQQGVIIPKQNLDQLCLDDEVVEAVKKRQFNIWAVEHIDEGLAILTGMPAGIRDDNGNFTAGSTHALVDKKLKQWIYKRLLGLEKKRATIPRESSRRRKRRGGW